MRGAWCGGKGPEERTWATPTAARQQHRRTNCVASLGVANAASVDNTMDAASMRTPPNLKEG